MQPNKYNLDIKSIAIIILAIGLILLYLFTPSSDNIDKFETEITELKEANENLLTSNDSIATVNKGIDKEIKDIKYNIYKTKKRLTTANNKIKTLEDEKNKIIPFVSELGIDGLEDEFTKYLERRESKNKPNN
tara:strand:+ start:89549 stop:89947 length:399 start_codon:yes stop_codon:yes gene_type:complete